MSEGLADKVRTSCVAAGMRRLVAHRACLSSALSTVGQDTPSCANALQRNCSERKERLPAETRPEVGQSCGSGTSVVENLKDFPRRYSLVVTAKCGTYAEVPVVNTGGQSIYRQQRAAAP